MISAIAKAGSIAKHAPEGALHPLLKLIYGKGHESAAEAFVRQAQSLTAEDTISIADQFPSLTTPARIV